MRHSMTKYIDLHVINKMFFSRRKILYPRNLNKTQNYKI